MVVHNSKSAWRNCSSVCWLFIAGLGPVVIVNFHFKGRGLECAVSPARVAASEKFAAAKR